MKKMQEQEGVQASQDSDIQILNHSGLALCSTDAQGKIVYSSPALERLLGIPAGELTGKTLDQVGLAAGASPATDQAEHLPQIYPRKFERPDGSMVELKILVSRHTAGQQAEGAMLALIELQPAAREPEKGLEGLEANLSELLRKNEELKAAKDQAVLDLERKAQLLATMSHEFRTPINAILGVTELLLLNTPLNDEQRDYVMIARNSSQTLLTLVNDTLDLSKIEAGKLKLEKISFSPADIVEDAAEMLCANARAKGLILLTSVDPGLPAQVHGDPARLRQVLLNLLANAIKFTPLGEVIVKAELLDQSTQVVELRFEVSDTGIGLTESAQARLFQPYSQVGNTTSNSQGGTGLGLAISRHLVEMMNGQIGVQSEEGEGACFWFTARFEPSPFGTTMPAEAGKLHNLRTLIAIGNPSQRQILQRYLSAWGLQVHQAVDGLSAVHELREAHNRGLDYHLACIDLSLPELDGFSLLNSIHLMPDYVGLRLILLVEFDQRNLGEQALEAGYSAYLTKPVRREALRQAILQSIRPGQELDTTLLPFAELRSLPIQPETGETSPKTILVVEDDLSSQGLITAQLDKLGYQTKTASNGLQALEALAQAVDASKQYGLILMDCHMPDMDGFTATRTIRQLEQRRGEHIPIIALTGSLPDENRGKCLAAGMDDMLVKPISLEQLKESLARWIPDPQGALQTSQSQPEQSVIQEQPPLDRNVLASLRRLQADDEPNFLVELFSVYRQTAEQLLNRMTLAQEAGEVEVFRSAVHSLKGSSANLGARRLASLCEEALRMSKEGQSEALEEQMIKMHVEYQRVWRAIDHELHAP